MTDRASLASVSAAAGVWAGIEEEVWNDLHDLQEREQHVIRSIAITTEGIARNSSAGRWGRVAELRRKHRVLDTRLRVIRAQLVLLGGQPADHPAEDA